MFLLSGVTGNEAGVQVTRQWIVPGVHARRVGALHTCPLHSDGDQALIL